MGRFRYHAATDLIMMDKTQSQRGVVLVIDDAGPVREAVKDLLAIIDVPVLVAEDGYEGLRIYENRMNEIAIILLDLNMPGLSGQETLQQLYELNPAVKVILSSGYSAEAIAEKCDGVVGFLQKPYDGHELIEQISQHLRLSGLG